MRVLIADKLLPLAADALREAGCAVTVDPSLSGDSLEEALRTTRAQVLVVRSTKVTAPMLQRGPLGLVIRAGAGVNTIDVSQASASGIYVANCPGKNSLAVAELAIGFLVALDRRIPDATTDLRAGRWRKSEYGKARGLAGRTLGVIGAGQIGMAVAERARALGMEVVIWNAGGRRRQQVEAAGFRYEGDLLALAAACDATTVHLAATPDTKGLLGADFFAAVPEGAYFINTSRDTLVDEAALRSAVEQRGVRAGLDVFAGEGAGGSDTIDVPLLSVPGIIATPHIGASTLQAQEAVATDVVDIVRAYEESGDVLNCVNVMRKRPASHLLIVRHLNRVGVLSQVFTALKEAGINVEETENIVFAGAEACIARIALAKAPSDALLSSLEADCPEVLAVDLVSL